MFRNRMGSRGGRVPETLGNRGERCSDEHGELGAGDTGEFRMTTRSAESTTDSGNIRSLIPARLDRLPWSRFHNRLVIALGVAWILDGLEITIASHVGPDLTLHNTLNLGAGQVGDIAWWYLIGEVIGALFFGHLSDKLGRKNLFTITLGVYLIGSGLTPATPAGGSWIWFLYATRIIAGMGIGGEY